MNNYCDNEEKPKQPPVPKLVWVLMAIVAVYIVIACGVAGYQTTETSMRLQPKTYTSMHDYEMFVNKESKE